MNTAQQIIFDRPPVDPALRLLWNQLTGTMEPAGMASVFTSPYGHTAVIDPTTPGNHYRGDKSWWTQSGTSPKLVRDGSGTYVWAAHNLLYHSGDFSAANWAQTGTIGVSGNTLTKSLTEDAYIRNGQAITLIDSYWATASILLNKDADTTRFPEVSLRLDGGATPQEIYLDINTQTGATAVRAQTGTATYAVVSENATQWRVTISVLNNASGNTTGRLGLRPACGTVIGVLNNAATGSIVVSQPQINKGAVPTAYVPTTTAAVYTLASDFHPTLGWGLLVEPAATNLCLQSRDLTNASWTKTNLTTALTSTGIDGVANSCTRLTATAANATARQDLTSASAGRITSIFAKRITGTGAVYVSQGETTGSELVVNGGFDADTDWIKGTGWAIAAGVATFSGAPGVDPLRQNIGMTIGNVYSVTYTITRTAGTIAVAIGGSASGITRNSSGTYTDTLACLGNGILYFQQDASFAGTVDVVTCKLVSETSLTLDGTLTRFSTASATITNPPIIIRMATSGDAIDVDMVQHEAAGATVATSPIPTTTVSVTRAADNVNRLLTALPFSAAAGTVIVNYIVPAVPNSSLGVAWGIGASSSERIFVYGDNSASAPQVDVVDGGVYQVDTALSVISAGASVKVAFAWAENDFAWSQNGGAVGTDGAGTLPTVTTFGIGGNWNGANQLRGWIKSIVYLPRRMSNTELQQRTA